MADAFILQLVNVVEAILTHPAKFDVSSCAFKMEGGWEIWLQVESACALASMGHPVNREQYVYRKTNEFGNALKTDIKILVPNSNNQHVSVELKVQSSGQDATFTNTVFETDILKVKYGFKEDIVAACGIIIVNNLETINQFDNSFMGLLTGGQRSMKRRPTNLGETLNSGNVVYWWALEVDPNSGKPILTLDSPEVFVKWCGAEPDLFKVKK